MAATFLRRAGSVVLSGARSAGGATAEELPLALSRSRTYTAEAAARGGQGGWSLPWLLLGLAGGFGASVAGGYALDPEDPLYTQALFDATRLSIPILHLFDAETSHNMVISVAKRGLVPRDGRDYGPSLRTSLWGKAFENPIGLAAGFDKNAEAMDAMLGIGFGFVEVGSITPEPQDGNAKPRIFRVPSERAVINRIGCNSHGSEVVSERIATFRDKQRSRAQAEPSGGRGRGIVGINIAKNKTSVDAAKDYAEACKLLADKADYVVINVSSPNTPGLRSLQAGKELAKIVASMKKALGTYAPGTPLVVKIAPDLDSGDKREIARVALRHGVDGLIVSNTTVSRPAAVLEQNHGGEKGGLSGRPVRDLSTALIKEMYELTGGKVPIIGCGGVSSGADALDKIKAGASLVQLYTGLIYEGPALVPQMKRDLADLLRAEGFQSVGDAVGASTKVKSKKGGWWG